MAGRVLALRADGGPGVGSGHLARCLGLALAWKDDGGEAVLLVDDERDWSDRYQAAGVGTASVDALPSLRPAWLVVDGYRFGPDLGLAARAVGSRVLVVDDHDLGRAGPGDALLDQNLGASPAAYRGRVGSDGLLLGPRFALLRPEFSRSRPAAENRRAPDRARRVLLSVGGHPPPLVADRFQAIASGLEPDHEVRWLRGVADVTVEMLRADLAVAAAGSTCWELCCLGLPSALVSTTENQRPLADALGRAGIAIDLGSVDEMDTVRAVQLVKALASDASRRQAMTEAGQALVDGRGARRVVAHLRGKLLGLRPADGSDARLLWRWVNDPATRAASFDTALISWEQHERWFRGKLLDPGCTIYLAEDDESGPVGQIRFDARGDRAEIDVTVAPEHRGRGWGPALVDAGVRRFFSDHDGAVGVDAFVKPENLPSARSFDAAGFDLVGPEDGDQEGSLRYVCWRHDAR